MKFTVNVKELSANLSIVSKAVPSRPSHPVLANISIAADLGTQRVSLSGFDLSLGIQSSFPATIAEGGECTLPSKLLTDIISKLSAETVTLEIDDCQCQLKAGTGKYKIRGIPADEYPTLPDVPSTSATIAVENLAEGLRGTLFASSTDEMKAVLTGVRLKINEDGLEFAATDGHRLAVVKNLGDNPKPLEVTIPRRALSELERILPAKDCAIGLCIDEGQVVFRWDDRSLTTRTLDGTYPNYPQLIPASFGVRVSIDRKEIVSALDRIAVLAEKNNVVKMTIASEDVTLSTESADVGEGQEVIPAEVSGDPIALAFNAKYLMEGLKALTSQQVEIALNTPTNPVVLSPIGGAQQIYLIMPVQLRS